MYLANKLSFESNELEKISQSRTPPDRTHVGEVVIIRLATISPFKEEWK